MKANVLTQYASHAHTIADTMRAAFVKLKLGDCVVDMTAPEGSTAGGLLALQHIVLKPPTGLALVVGSVNAKDKRAEIRSYAHVAKLHMERFKRPPPFSEAIYEGFVHTARGVLSAFAVPVTVTDAPRDTVPPVAGEDADDASTPAAKMSFPRPPLVAVIGITVGVALLVAAVWMALRP